jgi:Putative sensor
VYLLSNLPLGIAGFVGVVTLASVGFGAVVVWVRVTGPSAAGARRAGRDTLERTRVHALLGASVAWPYRPLLPTGQRARWVARVTDGPTWRDIAYRVVLLPIG